MNLIENDLINYLQKKNLKSFEHFDPHLMILVTILK